MFLHTVGHNLRNRVVGHNFHRSGETVSRYFNKVLCAVGELRGDLIRPPSLQTPTKIAGNHRWDPYFKDCIGVIDGTHIRASVPKDVENSFRGRKSYPTQNVMAAVDFDLRFTYVLACWEGTAHDALILRDALERENGLRVPQGKFYLVDAGYGAKPGFLPPFRGVRYHLNEWGSNPVQNEKELFNLRHSSLRVTVERAFGSLKRRFKVLDDAIPFFPFPTQVDIVIACCIIHNFVIQDGCDEFIIPETNWKSQTCCNSTGATMDASEGQGGTNGTATWGPMQSAFMLSYLANLVASGAKTSSGFKMSHYNACAKAINEKFNSKYKGEHVKNHLRTWSRKFQRMNKLKNISAAGWDENNFIITLDEEHYNSYVADHKPDAEYLNKPLEHYGLMQTIFGNSMAKGKYAKDSSSNLGTEPVDVENEEVQEQKEVEFSDASAIPSTHGPIPSEQGATSVSRPKSKRARRAESEEEAMLAVFKDVGDNIAKAIEKVAAPPPPPPTNDLPDDLFDMVQSIPGFQPAHYDFYFGYLVENPHIGRAFYKLPFASKLTWLSAFVSQRRDPDTWWNGSMVIWYDDMARLSV
ncbi:hypothetical protein U9M48_002174 [Paspalum notatum var. saurae]|uniref:Transposase n=1 Tax=Paspalum notatum var. saurae TaxID=547442 RepID=A0AAQ3SDC4_PASNO